MKIMFDTETLAELLCLIEGDGRYSFLNGGITTYPDDNKELHAACEQLERLGFIYRKRETSDSVIWMPIKEKQATVLFPPAPARFVAR